MIWMRSRVDGRCRHWRRLIGANIGVGVALLLATGVLAGSRPLAEERDRPRVYVFTADATSPAAREEEQGRVDSVADLRDALRGNRKILLVESASQAQVRVEVVGREKRELPGGGFGGTTITKPVETIVRLHVTFGDRDGDIKGTGQATWGRAAKDAAERLVKWITRTPLKPPVGGVTNRTLN
jgi:hypothetical protein